MRTSSGFEPRSVTVEKAPKPPVRVTLAPGTSSNSVPRSSVARGLRSGLSTVAAAVRSSRGVASGSTGATTVVSLNGLAGNGLAGNGLAGNGLAGNGLAGRWSSFVPASTGRAASGRPPSAVSVEAYSAAPSRAQALRPSHATNAATATQTRVLGENPEEQRETRYVGADVERPARATSAARCGMKNPLASRRRGAGRR